MINKTQEVRVNEEFEDVSVIWRTCKREKWKSADQTQKKILINIL